MDIIEAINNRHSVRQYKDIPIGEDLKKGTECPGRRVQQRKRITYPADSG